MHIWKRSFILAATLCFGGLLIFNAFFWSNYYSSNAEYVGKVIVETVLLMPRMLLLIIPLTCGFYPIFLSVEKQVRTTFAWKWPVIFTISASIIIFGLYAFIERQNAPGDAGVGLAFLFMFVAGVSTAFVVVSWLVALVAFLLKKNKQPVAN